MRQFRQLARLFFNRFLENDLICVDGDTRGTLIGVVALLVAPSVFLPFLEFLQFGSYPLIFQPWYVRDMAAIPDKVLHIAWSMTVLGLVTVFEWDAILPDRRDVAVLRPLPISVRTLFAAKVAALVQFWALMTLAMDGVSCLFFPVAVLQHSSVALLLWYIRCHALAVVAANAFMFLAMIAVQGILMTALGWARFRRVAPYAQFLMIVVILSLFFLSIGMAWGMNVQEPPSPVMRALPAYWFLGLDQADLGWRIPFFDTLAGCVKWALGIAALVAAAAYALSYRRSVARSFEEQDAPWLPPGPVARLMSRVANRFIVRAPAERATFYFVWRTVMRSRSHRLLVAAWLGAGFALVFQAVTGAIAGGYERWWQNPAGPLLAMPIVLPLFLVTGLRFAFNVPAELRGNWVFQTAGTGEAAEYLRGARKATRLLALGPLFALLAPLFVLAWGWRAGLPHVLYGAIVAYLLLEVEMAAMEKIPFTCAFVPGKADVKTRWPFYVLGYLIYVGALSWLGLRIVETPTLFLWFLLAAIVGKTGIEAYRENHAAYGFPLQFDERPEPAVRRLELLS